MLQGGVGGQDGVVRLHHGGADLTEMGELRTNLMDDRTRSLASRVHQKKQHSIRRIMEEGIRRRMELHGSTRAVQI